MAKIKRPLEDVCECGHVLDSHAMCDCYHCPEGVHECFECDDCDEYVEKVVRKPKAKK